MILKWNKFFLFLLFKGLAVPHIFRISQDTDGYRFEENSFF